MYLYLVSLISLVIIVIGSVGLINLALKQWVFTKADQDFYYSYPRPTCPIDASGKTLEGCTEPTAQELVEQEKQQRDSRTAQKQRDAAQYLAMIIVGTPVFVFHFKLARKET